MQWIRCCIILERFQYFTFAIFIELNCKPITASSKDSIFYGKPFTVRASLCNYLNINRPLLSVFVDWLLILTSLRSLWLPWATTYCLRLNPNSRLIPMANGVTAGSVIAIPVSLKRSNVKAITGVGRKEAETFTKQMLEMLLCKWSQLHYFSRYYRRENVVTWTEKESILGGSGGTDRLSHLPLDLLQATQPPFCVCVFFYSSSSRFRTAPWSALVASNA